MSVHNKIQDLQSQIQDTKKLLSLVEGHPIMEPSLKERLSMLEEELALLPKDFQEPKIQQIKKIDHTMNLNEYQQAAMTTCTPTAENFAYMMLNLVGEVGELSSKVAKAIRKGNATIDCNCYMSPNGTGPDNLDLPALRKEVGDVLWQVAGLCHVLGWDLETVAAENLDKLRDRQNRQVIIGDGDNR